eukprot:scaffold43794_cov71-Phaeocystis_antarctica.AAC.4
MSVTLDVSKLSGWLNAYAYCRELKRGNPAILGVVHAGSTRRAWRAWAGLGEERTLNMRYIDLTLDVLRVSGWLKDDAP